MDISLKVKELPLGTLILREGIMTGQTENGEEFRGSLAIPSCDVLLEYQGRYFCVNMEALFTAILEKVVK